MCAAVDMKRLGGEQMIAVSRDMKGVCFSMRFLNTRRGRGREIPP